MTKYMTIEAVIDNPKIPQVLYEDNHVIAVFKPHGMLTQGDATGDESLFDWTKQYLKTTYQKPGNVFLGLVHRIDRPVAGIVLFGKTSKGAARLSEQIRTHRMRKIYRAIVEGVVGQAQGSWRDFILKDEVRNTVAVFERPTGGALEARLSYRVIEKRSSTTVVEIELETGRPHQIRAQFAFHGYPLVGDSKYGARQTYRPGCIALMAVRVEWQAVTGGEKREIEVKNILF